MYHRLGKRFDSPTINMFFPNKKQYLKFISNLPLYMTYKLQFVDSEFDYPVGFCGDVEIRFNHYHSNVEANQKWEERKSRIHYDNLFIIMDDVKDIDEHDIQEFGKIQCAGKVMLTAKEYPMYPYVLPLSKYRGEERVGVYMEEKEPYTQRFPFDVDFDFVSWLNTGLLK